MRRFHRTPLALLLTCAIGLVACEPGEDDMDEGLETEDAVTGTQGVPEELGTPDYFDEWDLNQDGYVNEAEFIAGWDQTVSWEDWDLDADGVLDEQEFQRAFAEEPWYAQTLFDDWDLDGDDRVGEDEVTTGVFHTWAGEDTLLSEDELHADFFQ